MKTLVITALALASYLILDGYYKQEINRLKTFSKTQVRYVTPTDLFDEQFSYRDEQMGSLFDTSGPWMYRDDMSVKGAIYGRENPEAESKAWRLVAGNWKLVDKNDPRVADQIEREAAPPPPPAPAPRPAPVPIAPDPTAPAREGFASYEPFDAALTCRQPLERGSRAPSMFV